MITIQDIEMLANLLSRAGVNQYEAIWANGILDELRALVLERQAEAALGQGEEPDQQMEAQ